MLSFLILTTMLLAVRFRDFRLLWLSIAVGNSGRWVTTMGVGSLLYNLTQSSFWVGASMFMVQAPSLVVAPISGVLADRYDRRALLTCGQALAAIATAALAIFAATGTAHLTPTLFCVALLGVSFGLQGTAGSALAPNTVPRQHLPNAVALLGTARQGAEFLGPALAAPLLMSFGPAAVFGLASACYAFAATQPLRLTHYPSPYTPHRGNPLAPLGDGLRYISSTPMLATISVMVAMHCGFTMTYQGLLPDYVRASLNRGDDAYSGMMTMVGFGSVVGTLGLASIAGQRWYRAGYVVTAAASGLALVGMALAHSLALALLMAALAGASQAAFMAISLTFLQQLSSDAYVGRVTGVYNFFASGAMASLSWGFGGLASVASPAPVMLTSGLAFAIVVVVAGMTSRRARLLYVRGVSLADASVLGLP